MFITLDEITFGSRGADFLRGRRRMTLFPAMALIFLLL